MVQPGLLTTMLGYPKNIDQGTYYHASESTDSPSAIIHIPIPNQQ